MERLIVISAALQQIKTGINFFGVWQMPQIGAAVATFSCAQRRRSLTLADIEPVNGSSLMVSTGSGATSK